MREESRARMDRAKCDGYDEVWLDDKLVSETIHASLYLLHDILHYKVKPEIDKMMRAAFDVQLKGYEAKDGAERLLALLKEMSKTTRNLSDQNSSVLRSMINANGCDCSCERKAK